jgi:hypothetical protein
MKRYIQKNFHNGYVALMASIVISIVLLLLSTEAALLGWSTRFMVIANESKEQSIRVAHSCAELSIGKLLQNPMYRGNEVIEVAGGSCKIFTFVTSEANEKKVIFRVGAVVDAVVIHHEYIYQITDVHIAEPLTPLEVMSPNTAPSFTLTSWREMYTEP